MKKDQPFSPKYWVVHDQRTEDVIIGTASKSRSDAIDKFTSSYGTQDEWFDNGNLTVVLIELKLVDLETLE